MHTYETRGDTQLINRCEDGIRGMDHSINPRNSRDAAQHTYKTRGSSSLVVQESKSDISNVLGVSKINHKLNKPPVRTQNSL
jgi:hypothetical protein